jgi:single-strand DNA-binding protein
LAINSTYKDQAGQRKEEVCYVTIVVWAKQAELCHQYLKKGRSVCVEGRLMYRSWEAEGKTRSTLEVRADRVQFLGGPAGATQLGARTDAEAMEHPSAPRPEEPEAGASIPEGSAEADVPF